MKLTDSQKKAIEHDGSNLQLIACAGSGKTEVVGRRVVLLGGEDAAEVDHVELHILAYTGNHSSASTTRGF